MRTAYLSQSHPPGALSPGNPRGTTNPAHRAKNVIPRSPAYIVSPGDHNPPDNDERRAAPMTAAHAATMSSMSSDEDTAEKFPIAYSTAYLCLAALLTIRDDPDEHYGPEATRYAENILELIKAQPETVLTLPPDQLESTGPAILDNSRAWLN